MADFFSKSVREMTLAEVESLHTERVPENIRLEYKEKLPDDAADFKEIVAKELSAFANSYGGYFIIGISTDAKGNPTTMNGVPESNNLAQRVVSVGYEQIFPPVIPVVSNPITLTNSRVVYVVYQDLSLEAPHFLTRRRGAYVRTSEFSQTFTAELASWEELRLLHNRRQVAIEQREKLRERGKERCNVLLGNPTYGAPVALHLSVAPAFPFRRLLELDKIESAIEDASFWVALPYKIKYPDGEGVSIHESRARFKQSGSYCEGTVWGSSYSARVLEADIKRPNQLERILENLVRQIRFGSRLLQSCGFDGVVNVKVSLLNSHRREFRFGANSEIEVRCREPGEIEYELDRPLHILMRDYRPACLEMFKALAHAIGWSGVFAQKDADLIKIIKEEEEFFTDLN